MLSPATPSLKKDDNTILPMTKNVIPKAKQYTTYKYNGNSIIVKYSIYIISL
ncbi:hypothetical protein SGP14014_32890 [Shigella flexneri]|nr:hypothetical protein SGP14014_32890 [Shigella flexneri]